MRRTRPPPRRRPARRRLDRRNRLRILLALAAGAAVGRARGQSAPGTRSPAPPPHAGNPRSAGLATAIAECGVVIVTSGRGDFRRLNSGLDRMQLRRPVANVVDVLTDGVTSVPLASNGLRQVLKNTFAADPAKPTAYAEPPLVTVSVTPAAGGPPVTVTRRLRSNMQWSVQAITRKVKYKVQVQREVGGGNFAGLPLGKCEVVIRGPCTCPAPDPAQRSAAASAVPECGLVSVRSGRCWFRAVNADLAMILLHNPIAAAMDALTTTVTSIPHGSGTNVLRKVLKATFAADPAIPSTYQEPPLVSVSVTPAAGGAPETGAATMSENIHTSVTSNPYKFKIQVERGGANEDLSALAKGQCQVFIRTPCTCGTPPPPSPACAFTDTVCDEGSVCPGGTLVSAECADRSAFSENPCACTALQQLAALSAANLATEAPWNNLANAAYCTLEDGNYSVSEPHWIAVPVSGGHAERLTGALGAVLRRRLRYGSQRPVHAGRRSEAARSR